MNKARRKELNNITNTLEDIKDRIESALSDLEDLKSSLEFVYGDEQDYLDNIPENLQGSERYDVAEEACSNLEDAIASIDSVLDGVDTNNLADAISSIEGAISL